jgi:hypothetical protein
MGLAEIRLGIDHSCSSFHSWYGLGFEPLWKYFASWNAKTRKSIGRANLGEAFISLVAGGV